MEPLLLVANDLFHPHGHRIQVLARYVEKVRRVRKVSLVPPGLTPKGEQASRGGRLRGWGRQVAFDRRPLIWSVGTITAVRRFPLPGPMGPLLNRALLRRALGSLPGSTLALAQGPVAGTVCASSGMRFIYDHADNYREGRVGGSHRHLLGAWQARALRAAEAVSCAGTALRSHAVDSGARAVELHPNGVDNARFTLPRSESLRPSLLYVGGLECDCGLDAVLRALPLLTPHASLSVGGDGPAMNLFRRLADRLGVSRRVVWHGRVSAVSTPQLLSTAWIGVATFPPTGWNQYAFHLKILEYMAAGLPFVTTPVGDGALLASETGAGLVSQSHPETLAACIACLIDDADRRASMSVAGRAAAARYDWDLIGPRFAQWVHATLGGLS